MMKNKARKIESLKRQFPGIKGIKDAKDFDGSDGIHLGDCAEGGTIDSVAACDSYSFETDPSEKTYVLGIHKKLVAALMALGLYAESYDPGTFIAYEA